jgi:hypothetical protein
VIFVALSLASTAVGPETMLSRPAPGSVAGPADAGVAVLSAPYARSDVAAPSTGSEGSAVRVWNGALVIPKGRPVVFREI